MATATNSWLLASVAFGEADSSSVGVNFSSYHLRHWGVFRSLSSCGGRPRGSLGLQPGTQAAGRTVILLRNGKLGKYAEVRERNEVRSGQAPELGTQRRGGWEVR